MDQELTALRSEIKELRACLARLKTDLAVLTAELKPIKAFVLAMAGITMTGVLAALLKLVIL